MNNIHGSGPRQDLPSRTLDVHTRVRGPDRRLLPDLLGHEKVGRVRSRLTTTLHVTTGREVEVPADSYCRRSPIPCCDPSSRSGPVHFDQDSWDLEGVCVPYSRTPLLQDTPLYRDVPLYQTPLHQTPCTRTPLYQSPLHQDTQHQDTPAPRHPYTRYLYTSHPCTRTPLHLPPPTPPSLPRPHSPGRRVSLELTVQGGRVQYSVSGPPRWDRSSPWVNTRSPSKRPTHTGVPPEQTSPRRGFPALPRSVHPSSSEGYGRCGQESTPSDTPAAEERSKDDLYKHRNRGVGIQGSLRGRTRADGGPCPVSGGGVQRAGGIERDRHRNTVTDIYSFGSRSLSVVPQ